MSSIDRNKPTRKDQLRLIVSGVQKHYPSGQMTLASQTFNLPSDLVKAIQADIDATDAADKARADWLAAVQVQTDSHQKVGPVLRAFKRAVLARFGDTQDAGSTLADFGYAPQKVAVKSSATNAAAAEQGRATRAARHTMGSKQKQQVKGTVTPASPPATPASPPAAGPAAPVAPVASAPSAGGSTTAGTTPHVA
jgi:hypothetical protein